MIFKTRIYYGRNRFWTFLAVYITDFRRPAETADLRLWVRLEAATICPMATVDQHDTQKSTKGGRAHCLK